MHVCVMHFFNKSPKHCNDEGEQPPALSSVAKEFYFICIQINQHLLKTSNCMVGNCFGRKEGERERKREILLLEEI